jgi:hypothetical protein
MLPVEPRIAKFLRRAICQFVPVLPILLECKCEALPLLTVLFGGAGGRHRCCLLSTRLNNSDTTPGHGNFGGPLKKGSAILDVDSNRNKVNARNGLNRPALLA